MPRTLIVAHRGGAGLAPENTLAAFQSGLDQKADAVECDVHLSKDGELVVIHDANISRTTDGSGNVADLTLAELRAVNAAARFKDGSFAPQRIPTLQEVVDLVRGKAILQIEIKTRSDGRRYAGIEGKIVDLLRRNDMVDKVVVLSFDFPTVREIKALEPRLKTCALASTPYFASVGTRGLAAVAEEMKALGVDYMGVEKSYLTEKLLAELRKQGIGGGAWTVNDPAQMRKLAALGPDFLTSDRPDLLREALGR